MAKQPIGNSMALAQWFTGGQQINKVEDDFIREHILSMCYQASEIAVSGNSVLMRVSDGRVMAEVKNIQGCLAVLFDYVQNGRWIHLQFWMNKSSVADLGQKLRTVKRVSFESIMFNGKEV